MAIEKAAKATVRGYGMTGLSPLSALRSHNMWASNIRSLIARSPAPLLAGSLLVASVLLSAGIWSWMRLNNAPSVGTWTETGTIIQVIGDPPEYLYIRCGASTCEDTIDFSEFDSSLLVDEGDQVTVWVASVPETV